jgi:hypothetical protein
MRKNLPYLADRFLWGSKCSGVIDTGLGGCDDSINVLVDREEQVQYDSRATAGLWDCRHW